MRKPPQGRATTDGPPAAILAWVNGRAAWRAIPAEPLSTDIAVRPKPCDHKPTIGQPCDGSRSAVHHQLPRSERRAVGCEDQPGDDRKARDSKRPATAAPPLLSAASRGGPKNDSAAGAITCSAPAEPLAWNTRARSGPLPQPTSTRPPVSPTTLGTAPSLATFTSCTPEGADPSAAKRFRYRFRRPFASACTHTSAAPHPPAPRPAASSTGRGIRGSTGPEGLRERDLHGRPLGRAIGGKALRDQRVVLDRRLRIGGRAEPGGQHATIGERGDDGRGGGAGEGDVDGAVLHLSVGIEALDREAARRLAADRGIAVARKRPQGSTGRLLAIADKGQCEQLHGHIAVQHELPGVAGSMDGLAAIEALHHQVGHHARGEAEVAREPQVARHLERRRRAIRQLHRAVARAQSKSVASRVSGAVCSAFSTPAPGSRRSMGRGSGSVTTMSFASTCLMRNSFTITRAWLKSQDRARAICGTLSALDGAVCGTVSPLAVPHLRHTAPVGQRRGHIAAPPQAASRTAAKICMPRTRHGGDMRWSMWNSSRTESPYTRRYS